MKRFETRHEFMAEKVDWLGTLPYSTSFKVRMTAGTKTVRQKQILPLRCEVTKKDK